jgi:mannosylglycoprotein endo-beta-mannosidase
MGRVAGPMWGPFASLEDDGENRQQRSKKRTRRPRQKRLPCVGTGNDISGRYRLMHDAESDVGAARTSLHRVTLHMMVRTLASAAFLLAIIPASAQQNAQTVTGWSLQDVAKISVTPAEGSLPSYKPEGWYKATVPGTVLTTLVDNGVYPNPLYGENMRKIPESLNKTDYWYRTTVAIPAENKGRLTWLHFEGINYSAEVWVNGHDVGSMRGAFKRGDFNITPYVKAGGRATVVVVISPQPHPGVPIEHTVANGVGKNGGATAIDGPTFLSTIGWDWLAAVRDRDTGIWLPVTLYSTGEVQVRDPQIVSDLNLEKRTSDETVATTLVNASDKAVTGTLTGTIVNANGEGAPVVFSKEVTLEAKAKQVVTFDAASTAALHLTEPKLWWPNGYGPQNLYKLRIEFAVGKRSSSAQETQFGIRKIEYQVPDSENLTISVNGVKVMVRGGNWGLDDAMKRVTPERLDAQFHMHALANLNMIRNWVGQSTSPEFYAMADKYGILLWDEFFQPNPSDGPNVTDTATYLANVTDKVERYRNHPSIAVWCARNEGYPPKELDDALRGLMGKLDPTRLYQSNSADGRGVSSHGPYYWRSPRYFYRLNESFKTETGSMSVPTIESIQGMMPKKDWETINDDWAQHDMARGAQRGDTYPEMLATRYGHIRNLADFVRKAQLANYEAFRAMYEGRNAQMFTQTTGVLTWMSHPAQPSFVWQLYHYDLEPNASLYAAKKAAETVHAQLNEATGAFEVVNNKPESLNGLTLRTTSYSLDGDVTGEKDFPVSTVPASTTVKVGEIDVAAGARKSPICFVKLDLMGADGKVVSTNFYWQSLIQDDFTSLEKMPRVTLKVNASAQVVGENTVITVTMENPTGSGAEAQRAIALMAHLQLHQKVSGKRVLPVFYSDNYMSLVPGESRTVTIQAATKDLNGEPAEVLVDGFNVDVAPSEGEVTVAPNLNALPSHWPATDIVPEEQP